MNLSGSAQPREPPTGMQRVGLWVEFCGPGVNLSGSSQPTSREPPMGAQRVGLWVGLSGPGSTRPAARRSGRPPTYVKGLPTTSLTTETE